MMPLVVRYSPNPNAFMAGSGHTTQRGGNVPAEIPEMNIEVLQNEKSRNNSKSERVQNRLNDEPLDSAYTPMYH